MKITVAFRDSALRRATIRVELGWLDRLLYRAVSNKRPRVRAWNDIVVRIGDAAGELRWTSEGTGTRVENRKIVDAIERERTRVTAWQRLEVIARRT